MCTPGQHGPSSKTSAETSSCPCRRRCTILVEDAGAPGPRCQVVAAGWDRQSHPTSGYNDAITVITMSTPICWLGWLPPLSPQCPELLAPGTRQVR